MGLRGIYAVPNILIMPYRRLPKTDAARIKALKVVLDKEDAFSSATRILEWKTLTDVKTVYDKFMDAYLYYAGSKKNRVRHSADGDPLRARAYMFVSHFIQVLNLAVLRGEVRDCYKPLYGLKEGDYSLPDITTNEQLLQWGEQLILGERERLKKGGVAITNPSISKVAVHLDLFKQAYFRQKRLQDLTSRSLADVAALRLEVDEVLLSVWDQVEAAYASLPLAERYQKCKAYGLVYYYRRHEAPIEGVDL
ncbi:MAG: hypothetical protein HUJ99_03385 [Bacteroidaceae bacterium]|nr:hypothetical protein [Bacteroidaceae bacterium]